MYFPRLYPDELLYSAIARCRVHLGMESHKGLLAMLFGDTRVAAVTDLPSHLQSLADNTGLDAKVLVENYTLFPLYVPFIPQERSVRLYHAMLAHDRPGAIGLAGSSTALVKWPKWLRYCPLCFEDMVDKYGEPYWRRAWQVQGVDTCSVHGCQLLDSPIPFRRAHRHEFHAADPLFPSNSQGVIPSGAWGKGIAISLEQLLNLRNRPSPGFGRWTRFYQQLAMECGAMKGRQVKADVIWEKVQADFPWDWLHANDLWSAAPPPWLLAMFRKHRKAFSCLQHLVIWCCLRPSQDVVDIMDEANSFPAIAPDCQPVRLLPAQPGNIQFYRGRWVDLIEKHAGAKAARESQQGLAIYAWLYRHDRHWLLATNRGMSCRLGNHNHIDWCKRDRALVRRLISLGESTADDLGLPRRSRSWFLSKLPHGSSVEHHLSQLPLCRAFLARYAESVGEYQIRRLTKAMLDDVVTGRHSRLWQLERRCGLQKGKVTPLAAMFIASIGAQG